MDAGALVRPDYAPDQVLPNETPVDAARIRRLVANEFAFIWRALRRLGVAESCAEDAAQEVFLVAARKIATVPVERERAFLFAITLRVAADERRARRRRPAPDGAEHLVDVADGAPLPDEVVGRREACDVVDDLVSAMPVHLRAVFVLYEIEEMTMIQIAELLDLRPGTVASRLRAAREEFQAAVNRHRARKERAP